MLEHNFETGATALVRRGRTAEIAAGGPVHDPDIIIFDHGDVMLFGSQILVKMVDNPSQQYDEADRIFSRANQPAVGITYFHAKAWCLLKSLEDDGAYRYDLPTDLQYEYVASEGGTKEYGTETGTYMKDGRKLAHLDEYNDGRGTTVAVDDARYTKQLPFDVQTTGNVWRWIQMNQAFKRAGDHFQGPYGWRGGAWGNSSACGRASHRYSNHPRTRSYDVGFSPVVVRQDSQ